MGIGIKTGIMALAGAGAGSAFSNVYSVRLDGTDDDINCGNVTTFNGVNKASISMWFKTSDSTTRYLIAKYAGSGDRQFQILVIPNTRIDVYFVNIGFRSSDSINLDDDQWHHMVLSYDGTLGGSSRAKVYLDGSALTNVGFSAPTSLSTTSTDLLIGNSGNVVNHWNGEIDEVSLWTKALSSSEVTDIYNSGVPTDLTGEAGLAHWWRMGDNDGGTGTTVTDQVGSNDGTLSNDAAFVEDVPS